VGTESYALILVLFAVFSILLKFFLLSYLLLLRLEPSLLEELRLET